MSMGMTRTRAGAGPLHSPAGYRRDLYAVEADLGITDGEIGIGVSRATGGVPVPVCNTAINLFGRGYLYIKK